MLRRTLVAAAFAALAFCSVRLMAAEQNQAMDVTGTVSSVSQNSMTITTDDSKSFTFKLTDETQRLSGVTMGDRVDVHYRDTFGTDTALNVTRAGSMNPTTGSATADNRTGTNNYAGSNTDTNNPRTTGTNDMAPNTGTNNGRNTGTDVNNSGNTNTNTTTRDTYRSSAMNDTAHRDLPNTASLRPLFLVLGTSFLLAGLALGFVRYQS